MPSVIIGMRLTDYIGWMYDPPGGWAYGFPKEYLPRADEELADTLLRDGYPALECLYGAQHCRFFKNNT